MEPCLWAKRIDEEEKVSGSRRRLKQIDFESDSHDAGFSGSTYELRIQSIPSPW